jgi:hypothetical protein
MTKVFNNEGMSLDGNTLIVVGDGVTGGTETTGDNLLV